MRILDKGEQYDLLVTDQNFGPLAAKKGTDVIAQLRALRLPEVPLPAMILCSGSVSTSEVFHGDAAPDVRWQKPLPDWRNGEMQRTLAPLLAHIKPASTSGDRRTSASPSSSASTVRAVDSAPPDPRPGPGDAGVSKSEAPLPYLFDLTPKIKALVADDSLVNRKLLTRVFTLRLGWEVEQAITAEEVLERVITNGEKYDMLVLDEHYGSHETHMTGLQAIQRLRDELTDRPIIIHCTADGITGPPDAEWAGLVDYVWGKPFPSWTDGSMQSQLKCLLESRALPAMAIARV